MGHLPHPVFLPCPSTIISSIDKRDSLNASAQLLVKELHTERFSTSVTKRFKAIASMSIREAIIEKMNLEFERVLNATNDIKKATDAVHSLGLVLSVFEISDRTEFTFVDLHTSILELAKDLSEDSRVSKVIIICNCPSYKVYEEARQSLFDEMKKKKGKVDYKYEFELLTTKTLFEDDAYRELLTQHK